MLNMGVVRGVGGSKRVMPSWIFIYGIDIKDRSLIVLFFGLFSVGPPGKGFIVLFFGRYLLFFVFLVAPLPEIFLPTPFMLNPPFSLVGNLGIYVDLWIILNR